MKAFHPFFLFIFLLGVTDAQPVTQIRVRENMTMQVPIVGKIEVINTMVIANGMMHEKEESKVDRFVFRWIGGSEGSIIDLARGYKVFYDDEDEEQWKTTFEKLVEEATNPDTSGRRSISVSIGNDDDESETEPIMSTMDEGMEEVNGVSARKWVITILGKEDRVIFEMWMAEDMPMKIRAMAMERESDEKIGLPVSDDEVSGFLNELSSMGDYGLEPIPGVMIKMKMIAFDDDNDEPKASMSYLLLDIGEEPFNADDFVSPANYKLIEKN